MGIRKSNQELIGVSKGQIIMSYVYKGTLLIWALIKSCFGNGYWVNTMPWSNVDVWRNNK